MDTPYFCSTCRNIELPHVTIHKADSAFWGRWAGHDTVGYSCDICQSDCVEPAKECECCHAFVGQLADGTDFCAACAAEPDDIVDALLERSREVVQLYHATKTGPGDWAALKAAKAECLRIAGEQIGAAFDRRVVAA